MPQHLLEMPQTILVSEDDWWYEIKGMEDIITIKYVDDGVNKQTETFEIPTIFAEQVGQVLIDMAKKINEQCQD